MRMSVPFRSLRRLTICLVNRRLCTSLLLNGPSDSRTAGWESRQWMSSSALMERADTKRTDKNYTCFDEEAHDIEEALLKRLTNPSIRLLPPGLSPDVQKDWTELLSMVKQFFFSKRDGSRILYYPEVRRIVLKLSSSVPPSETHHWISYCSTHWMVLFEALDILINARPVESAVAQLKEQMADVDLTSEEFLRDEERWVNWMVESLHHCPDVPDAVRRSIPIQQVLTLLDVMDQWDLWRAGDEKFIAYILGAVGPSHLHLIADVLDRLMAHGRPVLPVVKKIGDHFENCTDNKRSLSNAFQIGRLGSLAKADLVNFGRSRSPEIGVVAEHCRAWERIADLSFNLSVENAWNRFAMSSKDIRSVQFWARRVGNCLKGISKWPFPIRLSSLNLLTSRLCEFTLVQPESTKDPAMASCLNEFSVLLGAICATIRIGLSAEQKMFCGVPLSQLLSPDDQLRIYRSDNSVLVQIAEELKKCKDQWGPIFMERSQSNSLDTSSAHVSVIGLISFDFISQLPNSFRISPSTELQVGQILMAKEQSLSPNEKIQLRKRIIDLGIPSSSDLLSILRMKSTTRNLTLD